MGDAATRRRGPAGGRPDEPLTPEPDPLPPEPDPGASAEGVRRWRFSQATINLTVANAAFGALSLITGPVLARALGASGRGDLAAILVPLWTATAVAVFGQDVFATREAARGRPVGKLVVSLGALLVAIGVVVALVGIPISTCSPKIARSSARCC